MELYKKEKINPLAGCCRSCADSVFFLALQSAVRHHRDAPCAVLRLDQGLSAPDPTNLFNLFGLIPIDPTTLPMFGISCISGVGRSSWASRCSHQTHDAMAARATLSEMLSDPLSGW